LLHTIQIIYKIQSKKLVIPIYFWLLLFLLLTNTGAENLGFKKNRFLPGWEESKLVNNHPINSIHRQEAIEFKKWGVCAEGAKYAASSQRRKKRKERKEEGR